MQTTVWLPSGLILVPNNLARDNCVAKEILRQAPSFFPLLHTRRCCSTQKKDGVVISASVWHGKQLPLNVVLAVGLTGTAMSTVMDSLKLQCAYIDNQLV